MHILFLSRWFPDPPNNGSKLRISALLRGLAAKHQVTLLSFADMPEDQLALSDLQSVCDLVQVVPWKGFNPDSLQARAGYFRSTPRSQVATFSTEMSHKLQVLLSARDYDVVVSSQLNSLNYAPYLDGLPALLEESELGVLHGRMGKGAECTPANRLRASLTWYKFRQYMARQMKFFNACTVASEEERLLLKKVVPCFRDIEVIPNCVSFANYADIEIAKNPNSLVFAGPFGYWANYEAMKWFLSEVYPIIQEQEPAVSLTITGDHRNLPLPPASNVHLTGYVDDVLPVVAGAACSIAPLRTGGGTRLKILESMALGVPVVSTPKGAQGLDAEEGKHLLIADTPEEFADAVVRVLHSPQLQSDLIQNGKELVRSYYDWTAVMPRFLDLVERVAAS